MILRVDHLAQFQIILYFNVLLGHNGQQNENGQSIFQQDMDDVMQQ